MITETVTDDFEFLLDLTGKWWDEATDAAVVNGDGTITVRNVQLWKALDGGIRQAFYAGASWEMVK